MKVQIFSILAASFLILSGCGGGGSASNSDAGANNASQVMVDPATVGTISGTVKFLGSAPKPRRINMGADAYCKTQHTSAVTTEDIVVNSNGSLKNVYVYVKSGLDQPAAAPGKPAVLDQRGCVYIPHVLAVQTGQEVIIRNSDGVLHNVNARPKLNRPFNIGQPVKGMETKKKFAKAEMAIPLKCDVHPWMGGYIIVQNHSFHNVTGDDGKFTIGNLPPGTYEVEAWHEKLGTAVQKVTVGANETKSLAFTFSKAKS